MTEQRPENQEDLIQTSVAVENKKVKPLTVAVLLIAILLIVAGGVYAGMKIGKKQAPFVIPPQTQSPTSIPTQISIPTSVVIPSTNTSNETANWKTYTNKKYKFSLGYPSTASISTPEDCQSSTEKSGDGGPCVNTTITLSGYKYPVGVFQLQSVVGDSPITESWGKIFFTGRDYQESTFKIGAYTAYSVEGILNMSPTTEMKSYARYISVNGHEIAIWDMENRDNKKTFDQILSTFRFLE